MQREVHRARPVVGRRLHHHDARGEPGQDRRELAEAARDQLDLVAHGLQHPLGRAEEAAPVGHAGLGEHVVEVQAQRPADLEVLPVVALAQGGQEGVRVGRTQAEPDGVDRPQQPDGLLHGADPGHGTTLASGAGSPGTEAPVAGGPPAENR